MSRLEHVVEDFPLNLIMIGVAFEARLQLFGCFAWSKDVALAVIRTPRSSAPHHTQGRQFLRCCEHGEASSSALPDKRHRLTSGCNIAGDVLQIRAIIEVQRKLCSCVIWQTDRDRSPSSAISLNDPRKQYRRDRTRHVLYIDCRTGHSHLTLAVPQQAEGEGQALIERERPGRAVRHQRTSAARWREDNRD
jgi:hypothetical protein